MDHKELSELLECSVCLERLDHTSKVLPCQHTFCRRCLVEIQSMRKELRCPECRVLVEEDIDSLLPNILLIRILEGLNRRNPVCDKEKSVKQKIPKEPSAKVLYDYEPKEPGDLALSKGDFVILVRQVDENWYEGQVKGSQGFLPANYVEVINPLPCLDDSYYDPIAKALYDFDEVQEDDVLNFKQGDIISVTKRVDENWCEGKLDKKFGIFPMNFVEFNSVAKAVIESLELSNSSNEEISLQSSLPSSSSSTNQMTMTGATAPHPKPVRKSKILNRDKVPKRHTIHELEEREQNSNIARVPSRHSVEITSSERLEEAYGENCNAHAVNRAPQVAITTAVRPARPSERTTGGGDLIDFHGEGRTREVSQAPLNQTQQNHREPSVLPASSNSSGQSRPNSAELGKELYIALYNYRPQKEDEMELKAGESYCVIEKCKDGWFKGFSLSNQKRGVFPGNYVRLASIHNLLTKSRSNSNSQAAPLPSPRQYPRPINNGTTSARPNYHRSESAPVFNGRLNVHDENLVVNLDNNVEVNGLGAVQSNGIRRPLLPPPPESKTGGFWKKLKPKRKERSRSPPPLPHPPPYTRDVPSGHTQVNLPTSSASRLVLGTTPPPPYSNQTPPPRQVLRQPPRPYHHRQENVPPRERYRAIMPYPPQSDAELELRVGDIIYVSKKRQDGWYKGTLERNGKTGLFPGVFSEKF
ncbi:E3 ubiquitin-protein ligase SH3RF1-like [Actinia tenebrosa]|uniref:RING-type E3 ubiquitin transferase n=1 Tax=Actinia tenebrosa TaxID=6105 RepID=A0A6P8GYP5_ACTTE|nr:E3 ubiquitin-protein ligase SH3RF1-like [Actinia tenebrosa]